MQHMKSIISKLFERDCIKYFFNVFGWIHCLCCVKDMKEKARRWSPDVRQIDLDVNRTFRDHIMFCKRYDVKWVNCQLIG